MGPCHRAPEGFLSAQAPFGGRPEARSTSLPAPGSRASEQRLLAGCDAWRAGRANGCSIRAGLFAPASSTPAYTQTDYVCLCLALSRAADGAQKRAMKRKGGWSSWGRAGSIRLRGTPREEEGFAPLVPPPLDAAPLPPASPFPLLAPSGFRQRRPAPQLRSTSETIQPPPIPSSPARGGVAPAPRPPGPPGGPRLWPENSGGACLLCLPHCPSSSRPNRPKHPEDLQEEIAQGGEDEGSCCGAE